MAQMKYESMKIRLENVADRGHIVDVDDSITSDEHREIFKQWTPDFVRNNHPSVIQVNSHSVLILFRDKMHTLM